MEFKRQSVIPLHIAHREQTSLRYGTRHIDKRIDAAMAIKSSLHDLIGGSGLAQIERKRQRLRTFCPHLCGSIL
jgi:hypothetical protein